jgi:hypothetical protein
MKDLARTISAIVHAPSKVGKSTLMSTAPWPHCVFDVEGSWRFIKTFGFKGEEPLIKRYWNPVTEQIPRYDGTWNVCIVPVQDWQTLIMGYTQLSQQPHDFRTTTVDSVTEAQRKLKTNLRGMESMQIQHWGDLLVRMDKFIRDMRDLVLLPTNPIETALFVAETELKDGKWRPAMQGQIGRAMPYWVDLVGYLFSVKEADENGQNTVKKLKLLIGGDPNFECGERVQGALGDLVADPNISTMRDIIFGPERKIEASNDEQKASA